MDTIHEHYYKIKNICSYLRHSSLLPNRKTLLLMHGIGDSGLNYLSFLENQALKQFNILIPDFLGYGKSSKHTDYSFVMQNKIFLEHLKMLEQQINFSFNQLILVPHSMASVHAMLLCDSEIKKHIIGIINVEGSITQYGSFISKTVATIQKNNFWHWFKQFKEDIIFNNLIKKFPICLQYYASLEFCDPYAFLKNAIELYQVCISGQGEFTNIAGNKFSEINLPKIYCYGDKSLCKESLHFLQKNNLATKSFSTANHFIMQECFIDFVTFLIDWINKTNFNEV